MLGHSDMLLGFTVYRTWLVDGFVLIVLGSLVILVSVDIVISWGARYPRAARLQIFIIVHWTLGVAVWVIVAVLL